MKFSVFDRKYSFIFHFFHYTRTKYWSLSKFMSYEWKAKNEFYLDLHTFGRRNLCRTYLDVEFHLSTHASPHINYKSSKWKSHSSFVSEPYNFFYIFTPCIRHDTLFDVTRKVTKLVRLNQKRWPFSFIPGNAKKHNNSSEVMPGGN